MLIAQRWILARLRNRTLLQPRRAQRCDRGAAREAEHAAVPEARGLPPLGLREHRSPAMKPLPARASSSTEWKKATRQHRLPRRRTTTASTACRTRSSVQRVEVRAHGVASSRSGTAASASRAHRRSYGPEGHVGRRVEEHRPQVAPRIRRVAARRDDRLGAKLRASAPNGRRTTSSAATRTRRWATASCLALIRSGKRVRRSALRCGLRARADRDRTHRRARTSRRS